MSTLKLGSLSKAPYHHGDLRKALVAHGLRLIETRDAATLSLREVARAAGVSATAVYRHFPDKRALMAALAEEGLARLYEAQAAAAAAEPDNALEATGRAYVRFALASPALFRVTFAWPDLPPTGLSDDAAGQLLHRNALVLCGGDEAAAQLMALRAWSITHGLAMLMLDGRLPQDDALIDATISAKGLFPNAPQGSNSEASP